MITQEMQTDIDRMVDDILKSDIYANQSLVVEYLIRRGWEDSESPIEHDDIINLYPNTDDMDPESLLAYLEGKWGEGLGDVTHVSEDMSEEEFLQLDDDDPDVETVRDYIRDNAEPQEVYEWWLVSGWLCGHLEEMGEVVINRGAGAHWWGRCTTGQAIKMDGILQRIALSIIQANQ